MALLLTNDDVRACVTMADAIEAMESVFGEQARGSVVQPQRLNINAGSGWLRIGPAVLEESGWMGFKAMNRSPEAGVRYVVFLYTVEDGALVAVVDAKYLTTLRTGGTSAVATRYLARSEPTTVAVLGTGLEARAQLEAMHALGRTTNARVYSRNPANRIGFASELTDRLGIDIAVCGSAREAVDGSGIVVAAVKSSEPVLEGEWLQPGMHVNSVGTARPDQREITPSTFARSDIVVVDTREGVFTEAGDAIIAKDTISPEEAYELAELVNGRAPRRTDSSQITLFKSVGTAIQDVALAARVFTQAKERAIGKELGDFPEVKP